MASSLKVLLLEQHMSRTAHFPSSVLTSILVSAQDTRSYIPNPLLLLRIRPDILARPPRLPRVLIRNHERHLLQRRQLAKARHATEKSVVPGHRWVSSTLLGPVLFTVPQVLLDADAKATQVCEGPGRGAKGAVPVVLVALDVDPHVQVEVSDGENSGAGGNGVEMGDERHDGLRPLEREGVGGVYDVVGFIIDLPTCAEETDG